MTGYLNVVQTAPNNVVVQQPPNLSVTLFTQEIKATVENGIPQQNLFISDTAPTFVSPGIWIQTNADSYGNFEVWFEDGT